MANANDWRDGVADMNMPIEIAADSIILKMDEGYFFVTHEGDMVGPDQDRDIILTKAALYLAAEKPE